jgi:diaminohydroxyphosphoribosylaminopyrimidine deaminase/5-amino-6-(5-phosphoribosylamino)uracil reductase
MDVLYVNWSTDDKKFMSRCILLAQKGEGRVSPNPLVGAVIAKNGKIIGSGFHEKFGGPHAEVNAFSDARRRGHDATGATLYVSLEPCSHSCPGKKTPPCVPLVMKSGVGQVIIAAKDPNSNVCGICELEEAGIKVRTGLLEREAREQNEAFFKFMKTGKPFIVLKMAQSANGKIGIRGKSRVRLSSKKFDSYCHSLRNRYDAILVGINTVLADNPRLTCRINGGRNPVRIILDSRLKIPLNAKVLHNARKERVIIATSEKADLKKAAKLEKLGASVIIVGKNKAELKQLFSILPFFSIISVLVEGGAAVAASVLKQGLADKVVVAVSRKKIAGKNAIPSPFSEKLLSKLEKRKIGTDTVYSGYVRFRP